MADAPAGTVLLVDDDAGMRGMLRLWLCKAGLRCLEAEHGAAAVEILAQQEVDAMVLDVAMPELDGHGVLRWLRQASLNEGLPTLVLSAHENTEAHMVATIEEGAMDHVVKPFLGPVLVAKVRALVAQGQQLRGLRKSVAAWTAEALLDPLTGLFNRRCFDQRLKEEAAWASRRERPLALAMLDLDRFKRINDTYGHPEGDRVLRHVSAVLAGSFRQEDVRFRLGGEEFGVLFRDTNAQAAGAAVERAASALRAKAIALGPQQEPNTITFSSGVAVADGATAFGAEHLVEDADAALYKAKQAGRDRVVAANPRTAGRLAG